MNRKSQVRTWTRCAGNWLAGNWVKLPQNDRSFFPRRKQRSQRQPLQGFTLVELLVVIVMVGILAGIASPSWIALRNEQQLSAAQDQAWQVLRQTQARAISSKQEWQVSFRETNQVAQWATHPMNTAPIAADWQNFSASVQIDTAETTLTQSSSVYRVEFTHRGQINPPLGRLTFMPKGGGRAKRCVVLSTVLGAMRKGSNNATPDEGGRYCY